jgi:hypothetical protein
VPTDKPDRPPDLADVEPLIRAKKRNKRLLLSKPNVIGFDVGFRVKEGEVTDERVVKVYVSEKVERDELDDGDLIPTTLTVDDKEVGVDVEEATIPQPGIFTLRSRPLRGGSSIGHPNASGTLGICLTLNDGSTYILTNDHVIGSAAGPTFFPIIIQPAQVDGGNFTADVVADVFSFVPIDFGSTTITLPPPFPPITIPNRNFVDAALARVRGAFNLGNREIHWLGYPAPNHSPIPWDLAYRLSLVGRRVCKMGRTTEFTTGAITSVTFDTFVGPYRNGLNAFFEDQIRIVPLAPPTFSNLGDSGSLVVDEARREPVGLLFAIGNPSVANPLDQVMLRLGIPQL